MPPFSAEGTVSRYYLDWLLAIPWKKFKKENRDIRRAAPDSRRGPLRPAQGQGADPRLPGRSAAGQKIARERSSALSDRPGVGKSSLSKSIARALDRKFVRVSLGGVKDEAEIRGHRRTYIGSYPGQIIKGLKKAASMNPVFLLDEIDKLNSDFRGDPASALLEALDPEQNCRIHRPLPGPGTGSFPGLLHHHGQLFREHPSGPAGPHGSHRASRLYRKGKAADRQELPAEKTGRKKRFLSQSKSRSATMSC